MLAASVNVPSGVVGGIQPFCSAIVVDVVDVDVVLVTVEVDVVVVVVVVVHVPDHFMSPDCISLYCTSP